MTIKVLAISLMMTLSPFLTQHDQSKMLLGEWKVQDLKAEYPAILSSGDRLKEDIDLSKAAERFKSSPFIFGKDSVLTVMGKDGQWVLEKDHLHIRIILMKDEELMATIIMLQPDKLKFSVMDHEIKEIFTLTKVK